MNLTIITHPASTFNSVLRPVVFALETQRAATNLSEVLAHSDIVTSSGLMRISNLSSPTIAGLKVGDVVTVSGFTVTANLWANGRTTITTKGSDYIITAKSYVGGLTSDTGLVTLTNDNFQIRATVYDTTTPVTAPSQQRFVNSSLQATFDFDNVLKQLLINRPQEFPAISSPVMYNAGSKPFQFYVAFTEIFDDYVGIPMPGDTVNSDTYVAVATGLQQYLNETQATIADYQIKSHSNTGKKFLSNRSRTRRIRLDEMDLLSIYFDNTIDGSSYQWITRIKRYTTAGSLISTSDAYFTVADGVKKVTFCICNTTADYDGGDLAYMTFQVMEHTAATAVTETVTYYIDLGATDTLKAVWTNNRDGFDCYSFRWSSEDIDVNKSLFQSKYQDNTTREMICTWASAQEGRTGESLPVNDMDYLKEILYSRDVRLYDLTTGRYIFATIAKQKNTTADRNLLRLKVSFDYPRNLL
jgi:hypothetical protein